MSAKYTLNEFMVDFIACYQSLEVERLNLTQEARVNSMHHYFRQRYGENSEAFVGLHMKVMMVLVDYIQARRHALAAKESERIPHSLAVAVFHLVADLGIENPSHALIEEAELNQSPKN